MNGLIISPSVLEKLKDKHGVIPREVEQCFENCDGEHIEDLREEHLTDPPTKWFVAETNQGRRLKVIFINRDGTIFLKSAYEANATAIELYESLAY